MLETFTGGIVKHFAFPNGRAVDFSPELREYCRKVGYESVSSLEYGPNDSLYGNPYNLRRVGAKSPLHVFSWELARIFTGF